MFEKVVLVTRKTRLQGLTAQFNTVAQARFYLEHAGCDFRDYELEDAHYRRSLETVRRSLEHFDGTLKLHIMDRELVPTALFSGKDIVVALGQDGLVANTAKYVGGQPILGTNPDPERFDGLLLPFSPAQVEGSVERVLDGRAQVREVTLAQARLNDGQRLLAFNDLFIGAKTHISARYRIRVGEREAVHSSSGLLVSTGAGSTGWLSSVFNMAAAVTAIGGGQPPAPVRLDWSDRRLFFVVREPFASRHSSVDLAIGMIDPGTALTIESLMPGQGTIFSDGMEADFLRFDSGAVAQIDVAPERARLVVG
ncbi:MAG: NAD+ kinase [Acidobacteria bacterium]|nr:NAD+ kinase [Acidobacteriota bacterium]